DTEFGIRLHRSGCAVQSVTDAQVSIRLPRSPVQLFRRRRALARSVGDIELRHGSLGSGSWLAAGKTGAVLLVRSYRLLKPQDRLAWAQTAGSFVGRLEAMLSVRRHRRSNDAAGHENPATDH